MEIEKIVAVLNPDKFLYFENYHKIKFYDMTFEIYGKDEKLMEIVNYLTGKICDNYHINDSIIYEFSLNGRNLSLNKTLVANFIKIAIESKNIIPLINDKNCIYYLSTISK